MITKIANDFIKEAGPLTFFKNTVLRPAQQAAAKTEAGRSMERIKNLWSMTPEQLNKLEASEYHARKAALGDLREELARNEALEKAIRADERKLAIEDSKPWLEKNWKPAVGLTVGALGTGATVNALSNRRRAYKDSTFDKDTYDQAMFN